MNFSTDRDLLAYEPTLFHDLPWAGQQRLKVTDGQLNGTTLTSAGADFEAARIEVGGVVLIDLIPHEVITRNSPTELTVSLMRARLTDDPIPGNDGSELTVIGRTFSPQASLVHDALLHMLGLEPDDPQAEIGEQAIISETTLARLETLGTLEQLFSSAAALTGDNRELRNRADQYRRQFHHALSRATVLLDIDGDGRVDERRHFATPRLTRV